MPLRIDLLAVVEHIECQQLFIAAHIPMLLEIRKWRTRVLSRHAQHDLKQDERVYIPIAARHDMRVHERGRDDLSAVREFLVAIHAELCAFAEVKALPLMRSERVGRERDALLHRFPVPAPLFRRVRFLAGRLDHLGHVACKGNIKGQRPCVALQQKRQAFRRMRRRIAERGDFLLVVARRLLIAFQKRLARLLRVEFPQEIVA